MDMDNYQFIHNIRRNVDWDSKIGGHLNTVYNEQASRGFSSVGTFFHPLLLRSPRPPVIFLLGADFLLVSSPDMLLLPPFDPPDADVSVRSLFDTALARKDFTDRPLLPGDFDFTGSVTAGSMLIRVCLEWEEGSGLEAMEGKNAPGDEHN